jgi:hypothetical protein
MKRTNRPLRSAARYFGSTGVAAAVVGLYACGGSFESNSPDAAPSPDAAITYTVDPLDTGAAPAADSGAPANGAMVGNDGGDAPAVGLGDSGDASQTGVNDANASETGAGETGASDAGQDATVCDATRDPKDEPCVIADTYAIFVANAFGGDGGGLVAADASDAAATSGSAAGSMANPARTIGQGLALAAAQGKGRVYVCGGNYVESVSVTAPVSLYGGFSCAAGSSGPTWRWAGSATSVMPLPVTSPAQPVYALSISGTGNAVVNVEDMSFASPDASGYDALGNGASSIAAFVSGSTAVFSRCALKAGKGAPGSDGVTQPTNYPTAPTPPGAGPGAPGATVTCAYSADGVTPDSSTGGIAGTPAYFTQTEVPAGNGTSFPAIAGANAPRDGLGAGQGPPGAGDPGADGPSRAGGPAAASAGELSASGWSPTVSGSGAAGRPGQGAGGSENICIPIGVGGGPGGCGGAGGTGGRGGGASVALAVVASTVSLYADTLVAGQAGSGGNGGAGQTGQGGTPASQDCTGGSSSPPVLHFGPPGGNGAGGSGGGGGTAGISIGILYAGTSLPTFNSGETSIAPGAAGAPGSGGLGGPASPSGGNPGNPGSPGYLDPHASAAYLLAP